MIAIQEQHLIIAVLHLEVAMRPKPFNYEHNIGNLNIDMQKKI
jgi:hypothetical protein